MIIRVLQNALALAQQSLGIIGPAFGIFGMNFDFHSNSFVENSLYNI